MTWYDTLFLIQSYGLYGKKHAGACSLFFRFAAVQIINGCAAKIMNLPTSLGERTKRRASVYCSREYFDFVCFAESTYLANLTLKMIGIQ
jgi:hypothetical protein